MSDEIVVIDGPAGAGKSTVARALARRLGGRYLDTGAMYRALTLRALRLGVDLGSADALVRVVDEARLELSFDGDGGCHVHLDGAEVTSEIRTREVTNAIHHLADEPRVRERVVAQQRRVAEELSGVLVAEGRDLGSVVYPAADVKVYLDASVAERARRRAEQLGADAPPLEVLQEEIARRDERDRSRAVGPLVRVPDAVYLDTSDLSAQDVIDRLEEAARRG